MSVKFNNAHFGAINENPIVDSRYNNDYSGDGSTPPVQENNFLLLDGTDFHLLDNTDFLLLET